MRTLTGGIASQVPAQGSFIGYLCEITTASGAVLRLTSLNTGFSYNGFTWNSTDITLGPMSWDGGMGRLSGITFGDADLTFWALVITYALVDAPVRLYQVYAGAPNEVVALWSGRVGKCTKSGLTVQVELNNGSDTAASPRTRVQQIVNPVFLLPAGSILNIAGARWILERSQH